MVQLTIRDHTKAVNIARRLSAQNENDLMHACFEETVEPSTPRKYDHDTCQELANHLLNTKALPNECKKYSDVVTSLKRRETDRTDGTEVLS